MRTPSTVLDARAFQSCLPHAPEGGGRGSMKRREGVWVSHQVAGYFMAERAGMGERERERDREQKQISLFQEMQEPIPKLRTPSDRGHHGVVTEAVISTLSTSGTHSRLDFVSSKQTPQPTNKHTTQQHNNQSGHSPLSHPH